MAMCNMATKTLTFYLTDKYVSSLLEIKFTLYAYRIVTTDVTNDVVLPFIVLYWIMKINISPKLEINNLLKGGFLEITFNKTKMP